MIRILDWLWALPLLGYFGGGLPVHDHANAGSGGTGVVGTLTAGTTLTQNPIVASTTTTVAHGLSSRPLFCQVEIECLVADLGFSPGAILSRTVSIDNSSSDHGIGLESTAVNLSLRVGAGVRVMSVTWQAQLMTLSSWKITITPLRKN